jgi:hypothetical protein
LVGFIAVWAGHVKDDLSGLGIFLFGDGRESAECIWNGRKTSMLIQGDTAVELTDFVIQGTPRKQGEPFLFRGRAMVVYVRYKDSPTDWASIREIIQPAT